MCRTSQSYSKTPPERNGTAATLTTPPHAVEDASVAPLARATVKWRAIYTGPSSDVDELLIHWRNSPLSSRNWTFDKSIRGNPNISTLECAANMACVYTDAGRLATVMLMHFPAMRCSVRKETQPSSSEAVKRWCSLTSLSDGTRNVAVSESHRIPRYCRIRVGRKSHFLTDN